MVLPLICPERRPLVLSHEFLQVAVIVLPLMVPLNVSNGVPLLV